MWTLTLHFAIVLLCLRLYVINYNLKDTVPTQSDLQEEDKLCLKIHGYVSLSEDDSDFEQTNVELDNQYQLFKPPPIQINPINHRIIEITNPIQPSKVQQKTKILSFSDILKQSSAQSNCQNLPQSTSPTDGKTLSKSQRKRLKKKLRKRNADSASGDKMFEDHPNDSLGDIDNSYIWSNKTDYDNKFPLLGHFATKGENKPVKERRRKANKPVSKGALMSERDTNYLYYRYYRPDFESFMSFKETYLNGELKDYNKTEETTNVEIDKERKLTSYLDSEIHMANNSTQIENVEEDKPAKERRPKAKEQVLKGALISKCGTNYLYYPYDGPDFQSFMSFKEMYLNGELKDYNKSEESTKKKTKPSPKKRIDWIKKCDLKDALIRECDTNYLYYPYDSPDFENFMSFKEIYLNGELKDCNRTEETTNVEIEKKSELTSYLNSETHIPSAFQYFFNNSTQFENVVLSNEFIYHQGTGFYQVSIFTQNFLTNLVKLALQQNHIFTKEQLSHLDYVYKALIRIHALYEAFSRTPTFLQFSKDFLIEPTTRMKQNDLVHFGQAICKNVGITFSVEDAYMIIGKFYCSMNLTTEYDLLNLEVKENLESENFLLVYKNLNFIFDSFIATVLLNVVWIVKQKLHEYQIRQRTMVSFSDKRLINHFLKPEDFDIYSRAYSHLSIKNLEIDKFIIHCLSLNQNQLSLMRTYQSFKQKILMYDCTKVNETNLFQLILEDLTENRLYHYTTYNQRDLEYWQNSQESHENENKSLIPVFVKSKNGTSNITCHQSLKSACTNLLTKIWNAYFAIPKSALKTLFFYMCLKYFLLPLLLKMLELIFVSGLDIIILIVLFMFLCIQFIL